MDISFPKRDFWLDLAPYLAAADWQHQAADILAVRQGNQEWPAKKRIRR
jgi:hypothetical protein